MKTKLKFLSVILPVILLISSCDFFIDVSPYIQKEHILYEVVNNNVPEFSNEEITDVSFERYSELDSLGRCGAAIASIGVDIMPTEERESIGQVKPSGWQLVKYDNIDGQYLYNRCHLIGFQLTGENANEKNLITGTRSMNVDGMLSFENEVASYVEYTGNHVMYRVTPVFEGDNLVASGVKMEAFSVEDNGKGVCFNVYVYNTQPDIVIDYKDGRSRHISEEFSEEPSEESVETASKEGTHYVLNINSKRIHYPDCQSAIDTKPENKEDFYGTKEELLKIGYTPCGACKP